MPEITPITDSINKQLVKAIQADEAENSLRFCSQGSLYH